MNAFIEWPITWLVYCCVTCVRDSARLAYSKVGVGQKSTSIFTQAKIVFFKGFNNMLWAIFAVTLSLFFCCVFNIYRLLSVTSRTDKERYVSVQFHVVLLSVAFMTQHCQLLQWYVLVHPDKHSTDTIAHLSMIILFSDTRSIVSPYVSCKVRIFKNILESYENNSKDECRTSDTICLEFFRLFYLFNCTHLKIYHLTNLIRIFQRQKRKE